MEYLLNFFSNIKSDLYQTLIEADRWKLFAEGLKNTIIIAIFATIIGILIGTAIAIIKVSNAQTGKLKILNFICNSYLAIIRGTPILVQLLIMFYVVFKAVSLDSAIYVAILSFGINSGAYVAEIIRAGIMSIDKGQTEAGRSIGLSASQTMKLIVLPQAVKNVLPAIFNEFITLLKETSVAGFIAVKDLTKAADIVRTHTYNAFPPLLLVALIYLILVIGLTAIQRKIERRLSQGDRR
ncbi:MAG: amino acid ABC transporter permease [Oscillospiraceae bacterium]